MKKLLLASAAVVMGGSALMGGSARAGNPRALVPARTPAPLQATTPFSWTGCSIGAHVGAGWSRNDFTDPTGFFIAPSGSAVRVDGGPGFLGGGQVGCDYQFANNWVVGAAGDVSWADIDGQTSDPFFGGKNPGSPLTLHSRTDFIASTTGRLGYTWDHLLFFGKGGAAWSHSKYEIDNFNCSIFVACYSNTSAMRSGWTAGGGVEWAFAPKWSMLIEYDHYGFGTNNYTFTDSNHPASPAVFGVKQDLSVIKAGLNYHFSDFMR